MTTGPSGAGGGRDKGEAEQGLLDKALKDYWPVFTPWRLWVMDRNFPGAPTPGPGTSCPTAPNWRRSPAAASRSPSG